MPSEEFFKRRGSDDRSRSDRTLIGEDMDKIFALILFGLMFFVVIAVIGIVGAIPVYFLWNMLMPAIFGLKAITFVQAWGMYVLASLLFKSNTSSSSSK